MKKNITPINRNPIFFDKETLDFEIEMGRECVENDMNMSVVLYRVDRVLTQVDDVYEEANMEDIVFKTPIEIPCIYKIDMSANKAYESQNNTGRYKQTGVITINIYDITLEELDIDITYGDYIGVPIDEHHMEYFSIFDDGKRNFSNRETMYGFKRFWRTIKASPVDINEFSGK